jgi:hypothetical protein
VLLVDDCVDGEAVERWVGSLNRFYNGSLAGSWVLVSTILLCEEALAVGIHLRDRMS